MDEKTQYELQVEFEAHLFGQGMMDALWGCPPQSPENGAYWQGYAQGSRQFWQQKGDNDAGYL